jgi:large subunit ribosomal protein L6e
VVLLKTLPQGTLLVTGPFKVNGVPLRRVNARYVIATKTTVSLDGIDSATLDKVGGEGYFARDKKADKKGNQEAFFAQGEKPAKKEVSSVRAEDQKAVDKALLSTIKKDPLLQGYLSSTFSLRKGDRPHEMVF